jgi:translocation protein SEC63
VVKLRLSPSQSSSSLLTPTKEKDAEDTKRSLRSNEEKDNQFLVGRKDAEDEPSGDGASGWAHTPYWPGVCCNALSLMTTGY